MKAAANESYGYTEDQIVSSDVVDIEYGSLFDATQTRVMTVGDKQPSFRGREKCNAFSVGIELEGCDFEPFTEAQYQTLETLLKALVGHYPITAVTSHQDIAPDV